MFCYFTAAMFVTLRGASNTPEEEQEQLCMAKQLSLGSIPFDNGDNTEQTKEAEIISCP